MSLLHTPLESISYEDIQRLIDNQVRESQYIEYKTEVFDKRDAKKRLQFLGSISGFANSLGGDLLIGVKAVDGIPVELPGLDPAEVDQEMLRIREVVAIGIEPFLPFHSHPVTLLDGRVVIVVRILRSWNPPHGIPNYEHYQFFRRNSAGRAPMTLSELQNSFTLSLGLSDKIRVFRQHRLSLVGPAPKQVGSYGPKPIVLLHVVPFASVMAPTTLDLTKIDRTLLSPLMAQRNYDPISIPIGDLRFNLDGLLMHNRGGFPERSWHTQFLRDGSFEYADVSLFGQLQSAGIRYLDAWNCQVNVIRILTRLRTLYRRLDIFPPFAVMLSLLNVNGFHINAGQGRFVIDPSEYPFDATDILLPEIVLDSLDTDIPAAVKSLFDYLWNAAGIRHCEFYKNGVWNLDESWLDPQP